jgi:tetratricopeptide (TPR) repeat protein
VRAAAAGLVLALTAAPARADILALKDGRFVEGVKIDRGEGGYKLLYKNGEVFVPETLVKDCLIEGEKGFEPRNDEERARVDKGLVPFEGKWVAKSARDAAIAKRQAERKKRIEEAKAHREWRNRYTAESANFKFEYTLDPEIQEDLRDLMETYFKVFTQKWGIARPKEKLKVCFYHDYDSFLQVSGAGHGVLAYYRFVQPIELDFFYERLDPGYTAAVMFHEANHYLTHLINFEFHYPHNVNEAMAEYYGASQWDPRKKEMSVGQVQEGRLTEVLTDIQGGETKKLEDYLSNRLGYDDYTWGWSFVHFMMETPKYSKRFQSFFLALGRDKDVKRVDDGRGTTVEGDEIVRVFKKHLGVTDLAPLEKEWHEYIKTKLKVETQRGYERAAIAAQRTGQSIRARRFFKLAIEKGSTNPQVYRAYARNLLYDDKPAEAIELLRKGITLDPLAAGLYATLAVALRGQGGTERLAEAKRLKELAREIDPENLDFEEIVIEMTEAAGSKPTSRPKDKG